MWTDLKKASYRNIEFDFVDIDDGLKKSVAKFDYPYKDGSDLEDMGLEARTVRIRAVFFLETYLNLEKFIGALKEQGPGEVIHPVFGAFTAIPETVSIRHDERAYYAEVDITFVEHKELAVSLEVSSASSTLAKTGDQSSETIGLCTDTLDESLENIGITEGVPTAGIGEAGYMATLSGLSKSVRDEMKKIDAVVGKVNGFIDVAVSPFLLITSTTTYLTNLPGVVLGKIAGAIETVAGSYQTLLAAPGRFMESLNFGLLKIEKALGGFEGNSSLKASWHISKSTALSVAAAIELSMDEESEKGAAVIPSGFGSESDIERSQVMNIIEIDSIAAIARDAVTTAIASIREAFGDTGYDLELALKAQALTIQQAADEIRLRRESIIDYEVLSDMNLHMLAFNLYGDIDKADRLLRINSIQNPNFLKSGDALKVYM